jgi:hypothetical protein
MSSGLGDTVHLEEFKEIIQSNGQIVDESTDCAMALDTMDSCVGFVEGVHSQNDFEEAVGSTELIDRVIPVKPHQSLSKREVAMIRLQISENNHDDPMMLLYSGQTSGLPDLDVLNMCGSNSDEPKCVTVDSVDERKSPLQHDAASAHFISDDECQQCAICFDECLPSSNRIVFAKLPCCGHADETSTVKICTVCIIVLTEPTSGGQKRVGRCPRCRAWIVVSTPESSEDAQLDIVSVADAGQCVICNQVKDLLVENSSCDACFLGRRVPLLYECQSCHVIQRIPHPMYRYQTAPDQFGSVTWACQGRCGTFTCWRIRVEQLASIPVGDVPEGWGADYLQLARTRVRQARRELASDDEAEHQCVIL